jgi:hypothetical protein
MDTNLFYYLFARRWPVMLVVLAAIVFALVRWKRHPKVSALTLAGLLIFQFQSLFFSTLYYFLPRLATQGWTWAQIDNLSIALDVCHDIVFAAAIGVLAWAVFSGRGTRAAISQ